MISAVTQLVRAYLDLTKPTIMLLVLFTGATALVVEGSLLARPVDFLLVLLGLFMTGGAANAFNQIFERDIDSLMKRTRNRRPLPLKRVSSQSATLFALVMGAGGVLLFAYRFNWLTAGLALATILFYSLIYTLLLKPSTAQNIVIGGAAGAMAPVGAWTAATGQMALEPWIMFALIFLWTPPHFWALALYCRDDYVRAGLPMLPVVAGDDATYRQIMWYSVVLVLASGLLVVTGMGLLYAGVAVALGGYFLVKVRKAEQARSEAALKGLFGYSIVYLFALFSAMMVDRWLSPWFGA